jgi:hypothetical protein
MASFERNHNKAFDQGELKTPLALKTKPVLEYQLTWCQLRQA